MTTKPQSAIQSSRQPVGVTHGYFLHPRRVFGLAQTLLIQAVNIESSIELLLVTELFRVYPIDS